MVHVEHSQQRNINPQCLLLQYFYSVAIKEDPFNRPNVRVPLPVDGGMYYKYESFYNY